MESAFAKLGRAQEHFAALENETEAFRARDTHTFAQEVSDYALDPAIKVVTRRVHINEAPPNSWSLIIGDILTNLRAALDHAVYGHAAARQSLTADDERRINFPIVLDREKWPRARRNLTPLVDPAVLNSIELSQPFNHRIDPQIAPLTSFNTLVNEDKHRALRVVSYRHGPVHVDTVAEIVGVEDQPREWTDGAVVARALVRVPAGMPCLPGHLPVRFRFVIGEGPTVYVPGVDLHWPIVSTMGSCVDMVERILANLKAAGC